MQHELAINIAETIEAVETAFEIDVPIILWGEPGAGKSSAIHQIGESYGVPVEDVRLSQLESIDLRGLPRDENGIVEWSIPSFLPRDPESKGILFLDEINRGDPSAQAACLQLILDRKLGNYVLPPGWRIVAAANPNGDMMEEALANRFMHVYVVPTMQNWGPWARANGIASEVMGFLMFKPNYLATEPSDTEEFAFASPRVWEYVSKAWKARGDNPINRKLIRGTVGKGIGSEFFAYVGMLGKIPTIDQIIKDPVTSYDVVRDNPSLEAAACLMCFEHMEPTNVKELMQFVTQAPIEYQVLVVSYLNDTKKHLMGTMPITNWCIDNPKVF